MNRKDVGLVLAVCLVAGVLYVFLGRGKAGDTVVITVDGREYGVFDLSEVEITVFLLVAVMVAREKIVWSNTEVHHGIAKEDY